MADAVGVATRSGAECVAIVEIANWLEEQGVEKVHDPNLGGTVRFDWGWVKLVPAWHTSTIAGSAEAPFSPTPGTVTGTPAGLLINLGGVTVYHAGDTCLFSDMKLIAERNPVDVALLPIGGHYTMDRHDGAVAAGFIGAGTVIPMHYDTFPPIETDAAAFKSEVEAKTSSSVVVLAAGRDTFDWLTSQAGASLARTAQATRGEQRWEPKRQRGQSPEQSGRTSRPLPIRR